MTSILVVYHEYRQCPKILFLGDNEDPIMKLECIIKMLLDFIIRNESFLDEQTHKHNTGINIPYNIHQADYRNIIMLQFSTCYG